MSDFSQLIKQHTRQRVAVAGQTAVHSGDMDSLQ